MRAALGPSTRGALRPLALRNVEARSRARGPSPLCVLRITPFGGRPNGVSRRQQTPGGWSASKGVAAMTRRHARQAASHPFRQHERPGLCRLGRSHFYRALYAARMTGGNRSIRRLEFRWLPRGKKPDPPRNPNDRLRTVANGRAKGKLTEGQAERLTERIVRDALRPEDVDLLDSLADR